MPVICILSVEEKKLKIHKKYLVKKRYENICEK